VVRTLKGEIDGLNRTMRTYQRWTGESVLWFEYDVMDSTRHPIYDEGPSRLWYPPTVMPCFFVSFDQFVGTRASNDDGIYTMASMTITFQVSETWDRFRVSALNTGEHYRDRFSYGTGQQASVYSVDNYEKQGFVNGTYLTVTARGTQVKDDELVLDVQGKDFFVQGGGIR
jgi:hypothetical protein